MNKLKYLLTSSFSLFIFFIASSGVYASHLSGPVIHETNIGGDLAGLSVKLQRSDGSAVGGANVTIHSHSGGGYSSQSGFRTCSGGFLVNLDGTDTYFGSESARTDGSGYLYLGNGRNSDALDSGPDQMIADGFGGCGCETWMHLDGIAGGYWDLNNNGSQDGGEPTGGSVDFRVNKQWDGTNLANGWLYDLRYIWRPVSGVVTGRIWRDENENNIHNSDELVWIQNGVDCPVTNKQTASASVTVQGVIITNPDKCNPDPFYAVAVPSGTYNINVNAPPGWVATTSTQNRNVPAGGSTDIHFGVGSRDSQCVGISAPTSVTTGQVFSGSITMKNTGNFSWDAGRGYKLGSEDPKDNGTWSIARIGLGATTVKPGQSFTFSNNFTAPSTAGTYNFSWAMLREAVTWFGPKCSKSITVTATSAPSTILNVLSSPVGGITINGNPVAGGTTGTTSRIYSFNNGANAIVTTLTTPSADPAGYTWSGWTPTGNCSGYVAGSKSCSVSVAAGTSKSVTANYLSTPAKAKLIIASSGVYIVGDSTKPNCAVNNFCATVSGTPNCLTVTFGICGTTLWDEESTSALTTTITAPASGGGGYSFNGWWSQASNQCSGSALISGSYYTASPSCTVTVNLNSSATIQANYVLSAILEVKSSPAGANVTSQLGSPDICSYLTTEGTCGTTNWTTARKGASIVTTLVAPSSFTSGGSTYNFVNWTCVPPVSSGDVNCPVSIPADGVSRTVTANYSTLYSLTIRAKSQFSGNPLKDGAILITSTPKIASTSGVSYGDGKRTPFPAIDIRSIPDTGTYITYQVPLFVDYNNRHMKFVSWECVSGTAGDCSTIDNSARTIQARSSTPTTNTVITAIYQIISGGEFEG